MAFPRVKPFRRPGPFFAIEQPLHSRSSAALVPIPSSKIQPQSRRQYHASPSSPSTASARSRTYYPSSTSSADSPTPFTGATNPYTSRKTWPPDFSKLPERDRFRYEKTFRRRSKLKWARPRWMKATKIVQWGLIWATVGYWVFFLEVPTDTVEEGEEKKGRTPFDDVSLPSIRSADYG